METIKKTFVYGANILLIDTTNKIWIMGSNGGGRTGFGKKNKSLYSPIYTGIILDENEDVAKFYVYEYLCSIFTTNGKLFVAKNITNKIKKKNSKSSSTRNLINNIDSNDSNDSNDNDDLPLGTEIVTRRTNNQITNMLTNMVSAYSSGYMLPADEYAEIFISTDAEDSSTISSNTNSDISSNTNSVSDDEDDHYSNESDDELDDELDDDGVFNNSNFFCSLIYRSLYKSNTDVGFDLLESAVDDVIFVAKCIIFKKNDKIYFYNKKMLPRRAIISRKTIFSTIFIDKKPLSYFQLVLPFNNDSQIIFRDDFIYIFSGFYHHIITIAEAMVFNGNISWIYFQTNMIKELDDEVGLTGSVSVENIHYILSDNSVYVTTKNGRSVYKYCHKVQTLVAFVTDSIKSFIIPCNDDSTKMLFCIKNDGIYFDHGSLQREVGSHKLIEYAVDMDSSEMQLVLVSVDLANPAILQFESRYQIAGMTLFFNINGLKYYKLCDEGLIYYEFDNLYYCTENILPEHRYNTVEIKRIELFGQNYYYIYMFKNIPMDIIDIKFTNHLILIQCANSKYYYHTINTENFKVDKFTEIIMDATNQEINLVSKHYIIRNKREFETTVTLSVHTSENKFKKLLSIIGMLNNNIDFDINFMIGTKLESYGNGPKREFMESAVIDFSEKYLISHGVCCEFDIDKFSKFSDDKLICVGSMLHAVIMHSGNHLPIRLPLSLITEIAGKEPTIFELEYFAKLEDVESFNNIYKFKNDLNAIKSFGFDTYEECLKIICKYYHHDATTSKNSLCKKISEKIAKGFNHYCEIKNLNIMNFPTIDYYLSGDYIVDRQLLLKNLQVEVVINNHAPNINYRSIMEDIIKTLPENDLMNLLKNWSGTSIVKKSNKYLVSVIDHTSSKKYIHFGTCGVQITISKDLFIEQKDCESNKSLLIDMLTIPLTTMVD